MDAILPKPINGKDFYIDRLQSHTVIISVTVGGIEGRELQERPVAITKKPKLRRSDV